MGPVFSAGICSSANCGRVVKLWQDLYLFCRNKEFVKKNYLLGKLTNCFHKYLL